MNHLQEVPWPEQFHAAIVVPLELDLRHEIPCRQHLDFGIVVHLELDLRHPRDLCIHLTLDKKQNRTI